MRFSLVLVPLLVAGAPTFAEVYNEYPFDAPQDLLAPASEFDTWAATLARHAEQRPSLFACATDKSACRGRLRSFNRMMTKSVGLSRDEKLSLVNLYINRTRYDNDRAKRIRDHTGKKVGIRRNHWSTLHDFLVNGGDCEDYATSKYFMLREMGFAADDLRVVVTYERKLRGYHAVLAVRRPDGAVWLLDSDNTIRRNHHGGYRYVYAMNERTVWDHREDFSGIESQVPTKEVSHDPE